MFFFNLNTLEYKNIKKSEEGWIFYCSSSTKLKVIINYFSIYNLKTKKSLLFTKNTLGVFKIRNLLGKVCKLSIS